MAKIICADEGCIYCDNKHRCTAKEIRISWNSIMTVWDGRQEFHRCKTRISPHEYRESLKKKEEEKKP